MLAGDDVAGHPGQHRVAVVTETPGQQGRFDLSHGHVHDVVTATELDRVGPVLEQLVS
ncbi:hypothetical protein D3C79_988020 [compost metagenome]